ncbi:MAG: hypothetical protein U9N83_09140 [Thermodesulfobacteriota bacterium]|nr:hypothetical protein [Thermodesulfobacteriota bacterium]
MIKTQKSWNRTPASDLVLFVLIFALSACAENYGRIQKNGQVNQIFTTYQVLDDHRYYISGPKSRPEVILGVHQDYTLETTQWTQVSLTEEQLKEWVDWLYSHFHDLTHYYPYGSVILDPSGKQVGIWYSIWDYTPVIFKGDNVVQIYAPIMPDPFGAGGGDNYRDNDE